MCLALPAQNNSSNILTSKKGVPVLPVSGDFAVSADIYPFLQYFGNAFNGNIANEAPSFSGVDNAIMVKYFLRSDRALRVKVSFLFDSTSESYASQNDTEVANNPLNIEASVMDYKDSKTNDLGISVGYEFRRGYGRLQAFYGAEVGFAMKSGNISYQYGNEMTALNQSPTSFGTAKNSREITVKDGLGLGAGLGGFLGVEYFFAPKISIGAEFGLNAYYFSQGLGEISYETFNTASGTVQEISTRKDLRGINSIGVKTNATGGIFLSFHF